MSVQLREGTIRVMAATIASGWIGVGLNRLLGQKNSMDSPGTGVWLVTPSASAIVDRALSPDPAPAGWSSMLPKSLPWYIIGAGLFPVVTSLSLRLGKSLGWVEASGFDGGTFASSAVRSLVPALGKNVFEESAWRGYLTSELVQQGAGDRDVYAGVSVVWGLWHVPYYLFFLPEEQSRKVLDVPRPAFAAIAGAVMMAWTVPFTELYRLSGSVWPGVLMHSVEDAFVNPLVIDGHVTIKAGREWLISPIAGIIPATAYLVAGLLMRWFRLKTHPTVL